MRIAEIMSGRPLNEEEHTPVIVYGRIYPSYVNPDRRETADIVANSKADDLRGLISDQHLIVVDGYEANHAELEGAWNFPESYRYEIILVPKERRLWCRGYGMGEDREEIINYLSGHPLILRAMARPQRIEIEYMAVENFWLWPQQEWLYKEKNNATHSLLNTNESSDRQPSMIVYHVTPTRNLKRIAARGLEPRIGRLSKKSSAAVPAVYFFHSEADAETAVINWLGDEFGEEIALALLRVRLPPGAREIPGAGFEKIIADPIPPQNIEVLKREL